MSGFGGKYFHIAGSANAKTEPELIRFAHRVVQGVVQAIVRNGGGIVCAAGVEPRQDPSVAGSPSLLFDWTVCPLLATYSITSCTPRVHDRPSLLWCRRRLNKESR
jgi:hypothetical protein